MGAVDATGADRGGGEQVIAAACHLEPVDPAQVWRRAAASAIDWWVDAGVDANVAESPHDWLRDMSLRQAARAVVGAAPDGRRDAAAGPTARVAATSRAAAPLPATLPEMLAWRSGAGAPEEGWPGPRLGIEGATTADLMILVDQPEREDMAAGSLLSGQPGRLFDRMLAAIGRDRRSVLLVPLCTARPPEGRIAPAVKARLDEVARRLAALVAPRRLLLLGGAPTRALIGTDLATARGRLQRINLDVGKVDVAIDAVASFHPRLLLERPSAKAEAWKDWRMLSKGLDQ